MAARSFGQKNPTKIYGTVEIDGHSSMRATEITMNEWMDFIVNNGFDTSLFPNNSCLAPLASALFEDLRKGKDFDYLEVVVHYGAQKEHSGDKGIETAKGFRKLIADDTTYFSINNPIVGISFEQAKQFCQWKENVVNRYRSAKVRIALPTVETYTKVITNRDTINNKKCYLLNALYCNCINSTSKSRYKVEGKTVMRADSYWPSDQGLYNVQGNAAEMTSTEGIAMGGSFRHYARESYNDRRQTYSRPEDWLGFRFVVTFE